MKIAREGYGYLAILLLFGIAVFWLFWPLSVPCLGIAAFVVFFFRDPTRNPPDGPHLLVSPGDGKVVYAGPSDESDPTKLKVAIFLSLFNVHINRVPMNGEVTAIHHRSGEFLAAYNPDASSRNEQKEITIADDDYQIQVRQIVGVVARRIICRLQEKQIVKRGERYGLIQFGSRMEILLPANTELKVAIGDRVKGGESVIAERTVA